MQLTNLDAKVNPMGGPANAFTHVRAFPTAEMRTVVRPNFDTLYSSAWLDLTEGLLIVSNGKGRSPALDRWRPRNHSSRRILEGVRRLASGAPQAQV